MDLFSQIFGDDPFGFGAGSIFSAFGGHSRPMRHPCNIRHLDLGWYTQSRKHCTKCSGKGSSTSYIQQGSVLVQLNNICKDCSGRGNVELEEVCKACHGHKVITKPKTYDVVIERGMKEGEKCQIRGYSRQANMDCDVIVVKEKPHHIFTRRGDDLLMQKKITISEALCGFDIPVTHLDGQLLCLRQPPGAVARPGSVLVAHGRGMPKRGYQYGCGHLLVYIDKLACLLPKKPPEPLPTGDMVEEVDLNDYDADEECRQKTRQEAYNEEDATYYHTSPCSQQ